MIFISKVIFQLKVQLRINFILLITILKLKLLTLNFFADSKGLPQFEICSKFHSNVLLKHQVLIKFSILPSIVQFTCLSLFGTDLNPYDISIFLDFHFELYFQGIIQISAIFLTLPLGLSSWLELDNTYKIRSVKNYSKKNQGLMLFCYHIPYRISNPFLL